MFGRKTLERRRSDALSVIRGELLAFEAMLQRPRNAGDAAPDEAFVAGVHERLEDIKQRATQETDIDELDSLSEDAEQQGQLRAYICLRREIQIEGYLAIDLMNEWGVPKPVIAKLHELVDKALRSANEDPEAARSALRAIFEEKDSWSEYTSDYEDKMKRFTRWWLFWPSMLLTVLALVALHFPVAVPGGLLLAGVAGSCVSVLTKMPLLEVSLSGELESYERRILSRIGAGVLGSLIGCGLLGWGLISFSIHGQTFADVLNACSTSLSTSCTALQTLILLAVPMLFGFSERALTSFEQKVFGNSGQVQDTRIARREK
jgi:hypothetical protein